MTKRNELIWCPAIMFVKLFLISFLLKHSLGYDLLEDDKRQDIVPLTSKGWNRLLAALDEKSLTGGLMAYPRLGREILELQQAFIPSPRIGRLVVDPSSLRYDILLNSDTSNSGLEDFLAEDFQRSSDPVVVKKPNIKMIPRIGRKKRSISDDDVKKESEVEENAKNHQETDRGRTVWNTQDDYDNDYYFRAEEKKNVRSKNAFIPRIGKRLTDFLNEYEEKRAAAFTPRIGRAALIPRIGRSDLGRNDPRFRLKNRASFVPRIGRRAALIPRIGRSADKQQNVKNQTD